MRYSSQAAAEMAFDRFMDFADRQAATLTVFGNSNGSVEAFVLPTVTPVVDSFDDLDYIPSCNYPRRCHCVDCR